MLTRRNFLVGAAGSPLLLRDTIGKANVPLDLTSLSLEGASHLIRRRRTSCTDVTGACLRRIQAYQPMLNAFITVTEDEALATARLLDEELRRGHWRGPLHGVPIALKDNIDVAGVRTTAASNVRRDSPPAATDAEVAGRLKRAGAIVLGKTNMVEFATVGTSVVSAFGSVRNPWALDRTSGGSSSGSAAAVAARLCFGAIGTDTGGSIRNPAAICGITGLKTTHGRVSSRGVIPFAWSLDAVGPLARSAVDAAILLQAMAGYDSFDPSSAAEPVPNFLRQARRSVRYLRIGVARTPFFEEIPPELAPAIEDAVRAIGSMTAGLREVRLPFIDPDKFTLIQRAEAYAYHRPEFDRNPLLFGPILRSRLEQAKKISAAEYASARHDLDRWRHEISAVFDDVDLVVTPSRAVSEKIADVRADVYSPSPGPPRNSFIVMNACGVPALSMPCGFSSQGLPVGLHVAGPIWHEGRILALAHAYQERTTWHLKAPTLAPTIG